MVAPTQMTDFGTLSGNPYLITVTDGQFKFNPDQEGAEIEVIYYRKLVSLSDTATTNYLITDYPDIYLAGSLVQAKGFLKEDDALVWQSAVDRWVSQMSEQSRDQKYSLARKQVGQNTTISRLG